MTALARLLVTFLAALTVGAVPASATPRHTEILPAGVREIDVHRSHASRRVTDPTRVLTIVRWFDALRIAPSTIYYCPMIRYTAPTTFDFRAGDGTLLAHARTPGMAACGGSIDVNIRGRARRPLLVGRFLVRVERLLGMRLVPVYR